MLKDSSHRIEMVGVFMERVFYTTQHVTTGADVGVAVVVRQTTLETILRSLARALNVCAK